MELILSALKVLWLWIVGIAKAAWAIIYGIGLGLWNNPILILAIIGAITLAFIMRRIFKRK